MSDAAVALRRESAIALPSRALTIEQFLDVDIPPELSGERGTNRASGLPCQIDASTDAVAIWTWLEEFAESPTTHRSYRKEAERFYNWVLFVARCPLSSVKITDISRYQTFLANPTPSAFWIANKENRKRAKRGEANWRPFEKGLSDTSIAYASVVLGAMFSYLQDVGYLHGNPFATRRLKAKKARAAAGTGDRAAKAAPQYLSISTLNLMFAAFTDAIAALPVDERLLRAKYERMLFTTRFLANTGLRRDEMARAVMSDIYSIDFKGDRNWFIRVVGKGDKVRNVPLNDKVRDAHERYLGFFGLPAQYVNNHAPILLTASGKGEVDQNLTGQTVYAITREALLFAAEALIESAPDDAYKIRAASPHKFRHAFATILEEVESVPLTMVSDLLGHGSMDTTKIYTHSNLHTAFRALKAVGV